MLARRSNAALSGTEESPARRRRVPYATNPAASNGRRRVDDSYPIHDWTLAQVSERSPPPGPARTRPTQPEWRACHANSAYCPHLPTLTSARLNPDLADRYAEVERRIGHRFRTDLTMADVIAEAHDAGQFALIRLADIA